MAMREWVKISLLPSKQSRGTLGLSAYVVIMSYMVDTLWRLWPQAPVLIHSYFLHMKNV